MVDLSSLTNADYKVIATFLLFGFTCVVIAGPILVMILYGGWSKWILLAVFALALLVSAAAVGALSPE